LCESIRGSLGSPRIASRTFFKARSAMFSTHRSPDPIKDRAHPSTRRSSSELLRSGSSPFILRRTARLPLGSVPSSRHHRKAATFFREASRAPLRSVLRFSQPLDGFFCSPACELVSSRSHVQGSLSFRGFSPDVAVLPHRKALPPCRCCTAARRPAPTFAGSSSRPRAMPLDFEAFIHARQRSFGSGYSPRPKPLPSSNSTLLQVLAHSTMISARTAIIRS
jgi:hypothetical protein